ncbi:AraC family transcriptional regulator [Breznakia pachnodae]|uniref:AraC-like DNA-binding protein/mannose-6-phosphate isomerase-like protein (Cupin superfamily) n=1 Tax=Breznakia pachnodae TaxID=265178 RepID=A0ABU0DZQ2_9FIRM|nr:AraC family transcriptional regulator [Breznakia pachnodae]MDQ0360114.1 AraC-like DNA-binding protein/mannose-6-phosphate isomerase-like protein (cupin superfamily) [Breznakia pachnodae]
MIPQDVLDELITFTDEEIDNLNKKYIVDRSIYLSEKSNVIDYNKMLSKNQLLSVRKHARFAQYPKHRHNYIELSYVYSGSMTHQIEEKEVTIQQGELILLNQNIEHEIQFTGEDDIIFNFIIRPEFLEFLSSMVDEQNEVFNFIFQALYSYDNSGEFLVFKTAVNEEVRDIVANIITKIYRPQMNNDLTLKLLVGLLLTELINRPDQIEAYRNESYEKLISSSILKYINTNYKEGSLKVLSKQIHQPDYKICKIIKKHTGSTFKQLVQNERLKNSESLLKTTNMAVVDVMEAVGYENITYFYKIFKGKYHMTPNEFRMKLKATK